ncbi:uncharacterized protein G2W53_018429 [Senna tora]|uniref:Uncharacterized protein n=1 Tax=Senna tora TaxID=362788 RepID=A0A834TRR7_9FABA|nr:uncharacterized protein G2W53_018429 [Senna tora]
MLFEDPDWSDQMAGMDVPMRVPILV